MYFKKSKEGKLSLFVPSGYCGAEELPVVANKEGILFDDELLSWEEIGRLHGEAFNGIALPFGRIIEFGSKVTLKPNTEYFTEWYHISTEGCAVRVSSQILGDMSPVVKDPVSFSVNKFGWQTSAYRPSAGDKIYLRFTTPFNGSAEYYLMVNDNIGSKITVNVKE